MTAFPLLTGHHAAPGPSALAQVMTAKTYHGTPGGIGPCLLGAVLVVAIAACIIARRHARRTQPRGNREPGRTWPEPPWPASYRHDRPDPSPRAAASEERQGRRAASYEESRTEL